MKTLNKKIISKMSGFLVVMILAATSCKKLIEIPPSPINQIPESHVFADSADLMGAVAGIYSNFGVSAGTRNFGNGEVTINTGLAADEIVPQIAVANDDVQFFQNAIQPVNGRTGNNWSDAYKCIYQMNVCLAGISNSNVISNTLKTQLQAEIRTTRALYYFNMVNIWGPVPLVLSTDYKSTKSLPRAPVDTIYKQILLDLTSAQNDLTSAYPSNGRVRPNQYVASALLAKVYLYRGEWQKAADAAAKVINSGMYTLAEDLNRVFLDGSQEAIWQLPANGRYVATPEGFALLPTNGEELSFDYPPVYSLSSHLINAFESGDQRLSLWTGHFSVDNITYYYARKYKNLKPSATPIEDYMILRLGELYLIRAEALAHSGNLAGAKDDLDLIRNRAGLLPSKAIGQTDILTTIMHERQTELFCEWGNRWFDLKRSGSINTILGSEKPGWKATAALFPVPLSELQSNPFLVQNPGYPGAK